VPASGSSDKKNSQPSASVTDDPSDCYRVPLDLARVAIPACSTATPRRAP
jgi:hypothetical protein